MFVLGRLFATSAGKKPSIFRHQMKAIVCLPFEKKKKIPFDTIHFFLLFDWLELST